MYLFEPVVLRAFACLSSDVPLSNRMVCVCVCVSRDGVSLTTRATGVGQVFVVDLL